MLGKKASACQCGTSPRQGEHRRASEPSRKGAPPSSSETECNQGGPRLAICPFGGVPRQGLPCGTSPQQGAGQSRQRGWWRGPQGFALRGTLMRSCRRQENASWKWRSRVSVCHANAEDDLLPTPPTPACASQAIASTVPSCQQYLPRRGQLQLAED